MLRFFILPPIDEWSLHHQRRLIRREAFAVRQSPLTSFLFCTYLNDMALHQYQSLPLAIFLPLLVITFNCHCVDHQNSGGQDVIILVARGGDPNSSRDKVIIPHVKDGQQPQLPCLITGVGIYEHGQTFTKGNFHYNCKNGTAEVIACIAEDMSVIQIGRTFLRNGTRHKCVVNGNMALYEQRSTCFENGVYYDVGDTFKNGSFKVICKDTGVAVLGCFLLNSTEDAILLGESRLIGTKRHSCEITESGKIRYVIRILGCQGQNGSEEDLKPGQTWVDKHIRYYCTEEGEKKVLGCVDDGGLFIELGHDVMMGGTVHRCYKFQNVTYYHRFHCDKDRSLAECISSTKTPKLKRMKH
uniref:Abnormal cell migration protein 18-like fibronectin type I domain-containing protein n=1 Tax=Globodera rostochiensis TaxID=31243 RepID=A0A914H1C0_GLORO